LRVLGIAGARPNFMKIEPIMRVMEQSPEHFSTVLVHTGQHYDDRMSEVFFKDLGLRPPDLNLGVGSGSHAEQTGAVMIRLEKVLMEQKPDILVVVGDVNSTLAATITAAKLNIPVAHVEAGLRSFDWTMPEEINRLATDVLSSYLFTPSEDASVNLRNEGIPESRIHLVGNVMIDTLRRCEEIAGHSSIFDELGVERGNYVLVTLHRPSNVDDPHVLSGILSALNAVQERLPVVFPIHPRTEFKMREFGSQCVLADTGNMKLVPPLGYLDFLALEGQAKMVMTDSGGIQEETTVLGIPCLTLRENTERPVTVTHGTNQIVGCSADRILAAAHAILDGERRNGQVPDLWDGHAAERIVSVLANGCAPSLPRNS